MLAVAVAIWVAVFFGGAYALVWLIETFEGDTSECWWAECGTFGELLDDHDLLAAIVLGLLAALPAAAVLWKARGRFANRSPEPS